MPGLLPSLSNQMQLQCIADCNCSIKYYYSLLPVAEAGAMLARLACIYIVCGARTHVCVCVCVCIDDL